MKAYIEVTYIDPDLGDKEKKRNTSRNVIFKMP